MWRVAIPEHIFLNVQDVQLGIDRPVWLLDDGAEVGRVAVHLGRHQGPEVRNFVPERDRVRVKPGVSFRDVPDLDDALVGGHNLPGDQGLTGEAYQASIGDRIDNCQNYGNPLQSCK